MAIQTTPVASWIQGVFSIPGFAPTVSLRIFHPSFCCRCVGAADVEGVGTAPHPLLFRSRRVAWRCGPTFLAPDENWYTLSQIVPRFRPTFNAFSAGRRK